MDALTRRQFDRAMFAKERTLAIRVGDYASRDIKEASFEYGYIKGDTYKPGGTCAGSGKVTFTSIITTFNKLDILHPEIGLLVGDTYQWVKMGEYFINDIEIDRNRNTTTLELIDGMFKLNREYVTDLHFPAEVREVIQEICLKTGIELANDYFGISAMRYHVEQVPEGKKLSFRDMLSAMTQMIGMSCFFNREGKMEIRDLNESNITINADSYFLHGLTKSEIEYQIAGITCKTDKKSLTVGMKTGRSLELDNVFMTQSALNDLYYKLKNLTYYPYNLNYQGHLLLEVGQWVTIQTNKKETFKVPVLSQSFTFKGGLRGRISADSKAGNDTQYSYEGTITKQIKQQDGIEAKIQAQIEAADKDFDQKVDKIKKDFNDQVELAKAKAEEVKQDISNEIDKRFQNFDNASIQEAKRKAEEALKNAGASSALAQEAKQIGLDSTAKLEEFKRQATSAQTALSGDLDVLKRTIANDIRPKQAQAEAEIAKQVEALVQTKKELTGVKSAQATYEETTTRRLSELTNLANGKASKSELTQTAEELSSKIASVQVAHRNQGDRVSAIESNFKQRADSLDAGVSRLTEGLRSKADISSLNVTAENIRQSVKSLETNTQNKLDQKLSLAEFDVRAGSIRQEILNATKDKADKTLVTTEAGKLREEFSSLRVGGTNLLKGSKGPFLPDRKPANFDNNVLYAGQTSIYMEQGQEYIISAKTDGNFTAHHDGNKESDNVVLWIMDKNVRNYQIVSDLKTGTTGTKIIWDKPTGIYHLRVNTYHKEATKSVWDVKIEKGNVATDWSPAPEDTDGLVTEAKATFERTAQGLRTDLSAIQEYVNKDGQRQEALQRYTREESAKQATAVRELVARDYVGKSTYQEDVRGLERRFSAISTQTNNDIASKIAQYKQTVDGRFADIISKIAGKANQVDFQRVRETSQLYERILGNTENGIADKVARMAMTNQLFQVEVGKAFAEHQNLFLNSTLTKGFLGNNGIIYVANATQKEVTSDFISVDPNEKIIFQHWVTLPENGTAWSAWQFFDKNKNPIDNRKPGLNAYKTTVGKQHNINQITVPANAYFVRFSARMYDDGLIKVEKGSAPSDYSVAPNDALEAVKTVQRQLDGSWAVQNLTSAGSIVSQINATNNQILVEAEKIRFKGKTLADQLTAIDGYFKRLFVGEGNFATLNTEVLKSNSITADKLVMDMAMARRFVSSDIFTNTLASKTAFINQLQSVIVSSTLLEGYKGWIGGFQIGTHNSGSGRWITGRNQFAVGIGDGEGGSGRTALWVNWGYSWSSPGTEAWFVKNNGKMFCYNTAEFWSTPVVHGDLKVTGKIFYDNRENGGRAGNWVYSEKYSKIDPDNGYLYLYHNSSGYNWIPMNKEISDRRYKSNIQDSQVSGLDVIKKLKTYSYRKEYDGKIEDISCGIMAQDVQKYAPEAFFENPDGAYSYRTFELVPYLIKAIQELNQKIEKMEKTIA